jgi:hypothetical protein
VGRLWPWLAAVVLLGGGLRLICPETMEYKEDEAWLYRLVAEHESSGRWVELGMPSSQRLRIPGLSVWVFYPLGHLFGTAEPTDLTRGVQLCNLAALVLLVLFAWRCIPAPEREPWLWAAVLLAVNPVAVVYHRKLWPPCMLPLFSLLFLVGWWHRGRRWGAMTWGVLGACLGQIHASGFVFAAAVFFTTVLADRRRVRWGCWLAGSVLGCLPMVPWLIYLGHGRDPVHGNCFAFHRWLEGKFWGHWATEPIGLDLRGIFDREYGQYLRWPILGGHATYGAAVLQALAGLLGAVILTVAVVRWWRGRAAAESRRPVSGTTLILWAGFVCYGLLLTLAAVRFYRHYLLVTFPLMAVWVAYLALPRNAGRGLALGRRLLVGLCVVNALSSVTMLGYLHARGGAELGAFGVSYEAQVRRTGRRPPPVELPDEALAVTRTGR